MTQILIFHPVQTRVESGHFYIESHYECGDESGSLWISVEEEFAELIDPNRMDGFLVAGLLMAMKRGVKLRIEGEVSRQLYYHATHYIQAFMTCFTPHLHEVEIEVNGFALPPSPPPSGVATGFSGGVDSFHSIYEHSVADETRSYAVTHFLFNNVGSHGEGAESSAVFAQRAALLRQCAKEMEIPFVAVDSNIDDVLQMLFRHTHTMRNTITPLLMPQHIGTYLCASSYTLEDMSCRPSADMSYMDPAMLPLLGTEGLSCFGVGSHNRIEKTKALTAYPPTYRYLDVCVLPQNASPHAPNCSRCWKCLRTLNTLDALEKLESYHAAFDLARYRELRTLFMVEVWSGSDNYLRDIKKMWQEKGGVPSIGVRIAAAVLPRAITHRIATWFIPRLVKKPALLRAVSAILSI